MICDECGLEKKRLEFCIQFKKYLCNDCKNLNKYSLITKQTIKDKYLLKEEDYEDLKYTVHYMRRSYAYLYSEEQIKKKFLIKFKDILSPDIIVTDEVVDEVHEFFKQQKKMKKEATLIKLLRKYNFSIDDIPKDLVDNFINNKQDSKMEIERYCKKIELEQKLISRGLEDYIDSVCLEYHLYDDFDEILKIIADNKKRKEDIEKKFQENGIDLEENKKFINHYSNYKIDVTLDKMVELIKTQDERRKELTKILEKLNIIHVVKSEVALDYIYYGEEYLSLDEIIEELETIEWYYRDKNINKN